MEKRIQPDLAALEIAHKKLNIDLTLNAALNNSPVKICIENIARRHIQRRAMIDVKKLQANDHD
jgi:hypothetical protein